MIKRMLSWGLIFSLLLALFPVTAKATDETLPEDGQSPAVAAQCNCGAQPDEAGVVTHAESCPVAAQEEPIPEAEEPVPEAEEPATGTEKPVQETEEPVPEALTPPVLTCEPLDEENSSDMVLTVEGDWDSYAWESCSYGSWSDWAGESSSLILSKEDFTAYGFRCTVTLGEQSVSSETFAYDPSVLERPAMMANGLSDDLLYGSSDYIKFGKRLPNSTFFNIKGLDDGYEIQTTYADAGYRAAISVNGGTKMSVFYGGEPISVGNSLTAETRLEIVYGGRYVKVTYEVTNHGSAVQNFRIGSSADVMIDNNDHAKVVGVKSSTGKYTGLSMNGSPKNNYQFSLIAPDCDTLWYGYYSKAYINIFNDLSDKNTPYSKDSGMAWSWKGTVAPGQTWSRYVLIGAGELPPAPDAPLINDVPTLKAGEEFTISGTVGSGSNPPDTVHVSIGGEEYEAGVNDDGTFAVTGILPEDTPAGETTLTYWGTTEEGGISEIQSRPVTVVAAPYISLITSSVTVMEGETGLDEEWLRGFIKSHSDTADISPSTIDANAPGEKTVTYRVEKEGFTPATARLTVTVLPQPAALTQTTVSGTGTFALSSTMTYTGGLTYTETGFVYGAVQNPTLTLNDGKVTTSPAVNTKGGTLSVSVDGSKLAYGVTYYARAYAIAGDGTIIYGEQSEGFGVGTPYYGTFSVTNNGDHTFTITRTGGTDGEQTVYYRTVNGSAIGGTHFEHQAGSVTFAAGETSKTVTVSEHSVTSTYGENAATAYSNADRTYFLEIYRVVGGAAIDSNKKSAQRTMTVSDDYRVDAKLFNEYRISTPSGETSRGDYDGVGKGWTNNDSNTNPKEGSNAKEIVTVSNILPTSGYTAAVAQNIQYKLSFQAKEVNDGYQHIQISPGEGIDLSQYPYEGNWKGTMDSAVYAAIFTHGGDKQNGTYAGYTFPNVNSSVPNLKTETWREETTYKGDGYIKFPVSTEKLTVGFAGSGSGDDEWTTKEVTHYLKYLDTEEPQLLGVAPMAGGSYLPGDRITVALVFDEIVDSTNSLSISSVQVVTNWGTLHYAGGVNTNVLYFTGSVSQNVTGTLTVQSITNAENIKDMADDTGTNTSGSVTDGNTGAGLGTGANAPTVTVSDITNTSGTLSAAVSTSTAGAKLEYVWSDSSATPTTGWQIVASGSTVSTRQTEGIWYLHARATNGDGVSTYASNFYIFTGSEPVQPPSLTVETDNTNWAQSRQIAVNRSPANATVEVKTPNGTTMAVSGSTYTATSNGAYTFTLQSNDETITKMVTVSKLDQTAPTVEIVDLTNTSHTEAVTLTVRASDGESGIRTVTGTWSNGSTNVAAVFTGGSGVYTTTSPGQSGTWTLTVTTADNAGNTANDTSGEYTVNLSAPAVTVTQAGTDHGVTYDYTITAGDSAIVSVQLPEGFALDETVTFPTSSPITGSLTFTQSGAYYIIVTDAAGHVVTSDPMTVSIQQDLVAPTVRLSAASNGAKTLTIHVSVLEEGGAPPSVTIEGGGNPAVALMPDGDGVYTGTFIAYTAGTYTVTATDAANNTGSAHITVHSVMFDGEGHAVPPQLVVSGDYATRPADPIRAGYTFAGWYQNGTAYDFRTAVTADLTIAAMWTAIPAAAPAVSAGNDVTQVYGTENGTVWVDVVQDAGYTYTYQWYSDGTKLSAATGSSCTIPADLAVGTYYYQCEVTATRKDNGEKAAAFSDAIAVMITKASQTRPAEGERYTIHYQTETITVLDGYEVYTEKTGGSAVASGGTVIPGSTLYIRRPGSETHTPSDWTEIHIPPRPAAPSGVTKTDETVKGKGDGTVSGITSSMEYQIGAGDWENGTGSPLTGLPAEMTVNVRYPANETVFASEQTQVTIGAGTRTLTVTFDENGGTAVPDATGLAYGATVTAPAAGKTGYILDGWYNGETKWDFEKDTVTADLTLKARWTAVVYTITYELNGGSLADGQNNPKSYTVETASFTLVNPSKPGYTFAGWTENADTTPQKNVTIPTGTTGDKTYTAHWTMEGFAVELTADKTNAVYGETITLTAVPNHAADSVTYTYAWYKGGSAAPITNASGSSLILTDVASSGSYMVKVTANDGGQSQTAASDAVAVKISPKEISTAWLGLDQVYGDEEEVQVKISGIVGGDKVSAKVNEAIPDNAGSYALTATLIGDDVSNYTLKNSTATLTIQPKPVIFAVAGNTVQADGGEKYASITADGTACPYTVTYRQDGKEVSAPKQEGGYEIWVEITNPNYRHTDGSTEMQVGVLTLTQAPPIVYTVSFEGGKSAEGTAPAAQTAVAGGQITLPANPFTKEDYLFAGWMVEGDARIYQPGDRFAMPARNVTFTAQWQAVFEVEGTVTEKTDGENTKAENAVVSLWLGANKISEVATGEDGKFKFVNLVPSIYNLVVTKDVRTVTSKVELTGDKNCDAVLPKGATNSVVEVIPGSPDIVVGNLDTIFKNIDGTVYTEDDQEKVSAGGKVEITFIADEKQKEDQTIAGDMEKIAATMGDSVTVGMVMDYTLQKTVTDEDQPSGKITPIAQSSVLLEILLPLPAQLQGKASYSVYRVHSETGNAADKQAEELKEGEANKNALGEYFAVSRDKTGLILYVKCFSTYAIGYSDAPVTPTLPDGGSGSGGGISTPAYPPNIEQTEHGSVTTGPKNPQKGDKVTIIPTPEEGFTADEVIVTGPNGNPVAVTPNDDGTYTFTQPDGSVTITVTFRELTGVSDCPRDESCPLAPFADADRSAWYHDGVHYCVENGLMMGTGKNTFAPNTAITRGMIVTILWRLEGSPIVSASLDYDDVTPENWYGEAVRWAAGAGVATGYGNGKFGPNDPITREQMAAMLWRYAGSPHADGSLSSFADGAQISSWAQPAMIWAVERGLIAGVSNDWLNSRGQATRAQAATILMRFAGTLAQ